MKNLLNLNQLSVISRDWTENGPKTDREWTENRPTRLRVLAKYAAMLLLLLILGVGQMWAYNFYSPYIYFNNADLKWGDVMLLVGHGSYSCGYNATTNMISNTKLVYFAPDASWSDQDGFTVCNTTGWDCRGDAFTTRAGYTTHIGLKYSYGFNWHESYYVTGNTSGTINITAGRPGSLNATQGAKWRDTGTSYSITSGTWPASLKLQGTYISGDGTSAQSTITSTKSSDGADKKTYGAVVTGKITHSYESLSSSYYFEGWGTGSTPSSTGSTYSYNISAATTVFAFFSKKYTLTYDSKGTKGSSSISVSIANFSGTKTSGSSIPTGHTITFTASPATGYEVEGWYSDASCTSAYTSGSGGVTISGSGNVTFTLASLNAAQAVYCKFRPKTYSITLDGNGGSDGSATATYNSSTLTSVTHCSRASYDLNGYYTATSGGTKVINANGTLVASVSTYTNSSSQWIKDADVELHAQWTYNPVTYSVTYAVGTGYTSYGSLSAKNTSTSAAISSGSSLESGTGVTFTATPNTGYVVEGWYTNAACTSGKHDAGSTTYSTTLSGNITVYVKFVEKTWSVAFAAGTGGTVTTPNSTPRTVGQITGISIAATPSSGYTFNTWTITSGSGSFTSSATTNSNKFKPTAASTITASFNETKSTITVTTANSSQGTLKFGSTSKSWGATASLGVATTQSITATAAAGFRFVRWDLSGAAASSSTLTNTTITLKADGSGSTGTATAVFEEDLSSPWIVAGGNKIVTTGTTWRTTADANNTMLKKTGHSTESVVYFTVPVTTVCSGDNNENFQFKIYNTSTSTWYSLGADGSSYYLLKAEDGTEKSLVTDGKNIELRAYVTGDYEFKLDYSTSTPKLTVTWPVFNQVRISAASPTDATNTGNFDLSDPVSNVRSVKRTLNASTTYTFKVVYNSDFYGYNSGTFTRSTNTSSNSRTISTSGGDMTLTTDYAGDYTFKFNQSTKALSVDFPAAYKITFGKGAVNGTSGSFTAVDLDNGSSAVTSNSTWVKSGNRVKITAPSAKSGYRFLGWYDNNSATGDAITTNANCTITVNTTKTVYACYTPKQSALTFDYQTSATGYGSSGTLSSVTATYGSAMPALTGTLPTATEGYAFMGFYDGTGGSGTKYYNANGSSARTWNKNTESGTTLYAYYKKAEITAITFDAATVEASGTVRFAVTVSPTPVGSTKLCFTVLYSNDNPLSPQPTISGPTAGKYSFTAPAASGTYKVEAVLRTGSSCAGGTELDTEVASFQVAGLHTVTVRYKCGDEVIKASTTVSARPLDWSDAITAPDIFGYTFSSWTAGDGVTIKDGETSTATTHIKAIYDGTLTANYTQNNYIYFKDNLGWTNPNDANAHVYVNLLPSEYWNSDNGSGNENQANRNLQMDRVPGTTNIFYYNYGNKTTSRYVSFTKESYSNSQYFFQSSPNFAHVVYPTRSSDALGTDKATGLGFYAKTPMFVPQPIAEADGKSKNGGRAKYYNDGYWTKYTPGTGYTLQVYYDDGTTSKGDYVFTSEDELMPMKAVVSLEAGRTYKFQLKRDGDVTYGNTGTMTYSNHGQSVAWEYNQGVGKTTITTNAAGEYTFNLGFSANASSEYRLRISVDYPIASGDYRVIYKHTGQTNYKASAIIPKVNNGKDTVSFFIKPKSSPSMKIQQATVNESTGAITWSSGTDVSASVSSLAKDSVYNICLTMNGSGTISVEKVEPYTGNYYIRTDAANSKWDNYRSDPDHLMTYSEYSITHGGYSHYYCHWVQTDDRKNVKFCIANDYSPSISDTLTRETASGTWANIATFIESNGDIKRNANVRFMWNRHDNTIARAYVDGAQENGSRFLVISSTDGKIKKADGSALSNNEVTFSDNENWIYEANVKAQPTSQYKLISTWGTGTVITQYFKGTSGSTETLIDGSGTDWYDIRLLYDFKTNRLVAAWVPSDATITVNNAINADVMFIREHQGDIAQLTFGASGKISKIETAYGVIKFNKWTLANKDKSTHSPLGSPASIYERSLFWISFPFRVKLSEVFGFGTYGKHWAIQRYDGAKRAEIGHFAENGSFWRWMSRNTEYLEPNQGYLLAIDLDLLGESSDVWGPDSRSVQIELYFPSYGTMPDISNASVTQTIPTHTCTINMHATNPDLPDTGDPRTSYNRTIFDSHWNVLSVPTYVNTTAVSFANTTWTTAIGPRFLYSWNASDNTITATTASGYTYHAMHSYMVQYGGNLTWTASSGSPASIVARKTYAETPKEVEFRLELQQNEQEIDRTFVVLSNDEEVSADFQFGEDMTKEFNAKKSAIYTFIADEAVAAGNTLPMSEQTTVVPVGVDIKADGDYTFAMPDGTSGVGVVLIDNETGIRTSLSALDYTVFLEAGTYDKRFMMEISPIKQGTTGIDLINGDASANGVRKLLIDQKMYIIKGDKMYDATGRRVE